MQTLYPRLCGIALTLSVLTCAVLLADPPDAKEIAALIEQLGDDDVDVRQAAAKKLTDAGEAALTQLRKAAKDHPDAEVKLRSIVLFRAIEKARFGEIRKFTGHTGHIRSIAVTKDGKRAVTGSMDAFAIVWDLDSGKQLTKFTGHHDAPVDKGKWVWEVTFSPDEKRVISSGSIDKTLRLWDVEDGKEVRKFQGQLGWVYAAAYSSDGKYVLSSGAGSDAKDFTLRLYDVETAKEVRKYEGHTGFVWRAYFSPDGKKIASAGCNDKSYRIWDVETGKPLVIGINAHDGHVVGLSWSPDGKRLLTSGRDLTCKLWDAETGKLLKTYVGVSDNVEAVAFSPDGKRFLAGEKKLVHVFDTETGNIVHRFDEHPNLVFAVAWLPDGTRALSAGDDNVLRMWRVPKS